MEENIETEKQEAKPRRTNSWTRNIVKDPDAPALYSPRAIWGFSVFFTVVFGAVLLASNLSGSKGKWMVIGFGILYTSAMMLVLNLIPHPNSGLTLALNAGGALVLTNLFWNRFVGKETLFRTKSIWKPLIISVIITIPFMLAIIYG
jgi:hypothetical protein